MKTLCAWCKTELGSATVKDDGALTYEICPACRDLLFHDDGMSPFRKFLDRIAVPVVVVDHDMRIISANDKACRLMGKDAGELDGKYGGEALECSKAHLPGGCGNTLHCRTCTIRIKVNDTFATGRSHHNVPAFLDIYRPRGAAGPSCFLISTDKSGEAVLLRIEAVH